MLSNRRRWIKAARYAAYSAAALAAAAIAAALILPEILDTPAVGAGIKRKLSEAVQGEVAWDGLSIRILPSPRGVLRQARVEIPGMVSVRAEQIEAQLRFWPLLHGRAEITSVSFVRPQLRIDVAPSPPAEEQTKELAAIYRSVMEPVVGLVRRFAPDTVLTVEDAIVDVRAPGMPPIEFRNLSIRARSGVKSMELEATTAGNHWNRLKLSTRIEFSSLAAKASLDVTEVKPQAWLDRYLAESPVRVEVSAANLRAQASYDASTSLECDFDVTAGEVDVLRATERVQVADAVLKGKVTADAREIAVGLDEVKLGASRLHGVKLRYAMKSSVLAGGAEFDLDLEQGMDYTRRLVPEKAGAVLAWFQPVTGRAQGSVKLDYGQPDWSVGVEIRRSDVSMQVRDLPGRVRLAGGAVEVDRHGVKVDRVALSMPAGEVLLSTLRHSFKNGTTAGGAGFDLDLAMSLELARRLLPEEDRAALARIQSVAGRAQGSVKFDFGQPNWGVGVDVRKSDVAVEIRDLPGPVRLAGGAVEVDRHGVKVDRVALSIPAGEVLLSTLRHSYKDGATTGGASFDLDVARGLELVRRALPQENRDALARIQTAAGRIHGNARFAVGRGEWNFGVDLLKSDASFGIRQLPGPIKIGELSLDAGPASMTIQRASVSLLDASVVASMTLDEFDAGTRARGAIAEGTIGEKFLAWAWHSARLPPHFEPATPVRIAVPRIEWRPGGALEVQATAQFDAGSSAAVDLGWSAGALDIRRATIKDGRSDAELALRAKGSLLEGRYAGSLHSTSVAAVLKRAKVPSGAVAGDLRFTIDREHPQRMSADGHLKGEELDLAWLIGRPVKIERIDLASDETALHVREATVDWAGQRATLRGELRRSASGPVIDAQLDSPGVILDALLPREDKTGAEKPSAAGGLSKQATDEAGELSRLWPLPVTGRIAVRSEFIQTGRLKFAPVAATLVLEERRARFDLTQAQLCGISHPMTIEATPGGFTASAQITAQKQPLELAAQCLTDRHVLITGDFDFKADLSAQGKLGDLARNLKGTVRAEAREGKVMKFALVGNILSMTNVAALFEQGGPKLDDAGFPYRTITVSGHFEKDRFIVDESAFRSDAVGLAATGWVSVLDYQSRLSVLVAPFSRIDRLARAVPIFGYVLGGALTSVPVGVSGDIRDPLVVPLGPSAITSELVGIFERTLKLPGRLITPFEGSREAQPPDGK
jgi:hypothetical protein